MFPFLSCFLKVQRQCQTEQLATTIFCATLLHEKLNTALRVFEPKSKTLNLLPSQKLCKKSSPLSCYTVFDFFVQQCCVRNRCCRLSRVTPPQTTSKTFFTLTLISRIAYSLLIWQFTELHAVFSHVTNRSDKDAQMCQVFDVKLLGRLQFEILSVVVKWFFIVENHVLRFLCLDLMSSLVRGEGYLDLQAVSLTWCPHHVLSPGSIQRKHAIA